MPLITDRKQVLDVFADAASRRWVLPAFNAENQTTLEAILAGAAARAQELGAKKVPIIVDITNRYWHRSQTVNYSHTNDWRLGMKLFLADLKVLTEAPSPFAGLDVLVHLDHIQWNDDAELLSWDMKQFSSIMFDASTLPMEENIARTAEFVARCGKDIVVEGACDEIGEASHPSGNELTRPDTAERYVKATGVDIIVANLGTEHRASAATLQYHGDLARQISGKIGPRLCLHGASSVTPDRIAKLFDDGVSRVNLWTTLERDSAPKVLADMLQHAAKVAGPKLASQWLKEGLLGPAADVTSSASLDYYTSTYRQTIAFSAQKDIVLNYLRLWYV